MAALKLTEAEMKTLRRDLHAAAAWHNSLADSYAGTRGFGDMKATAELHEKETRALLKKLFGDTRVANVDRPPGAKSVSIFSVMGKK